jgi:hypothetical protein
MYSPLERETDEEAYSRFSQFCERVENSSEVSRALLFAYVCVSVCLNNPQRLFDEATST